MARFDGLEALADRLRIFGSDQIRATVALAVSRIPEEVQRFAAAHCVFLSLPEGIEGRTWPARIATGPDGSDEHRWIIQLRSPLPEEASEATVAHELAHAFLRHDRTSYDAGPEAEREAAELAGSWGFTGYPTDPDYCTRLYHLEDSNG